MVLDEGDGGLGALDHVFVPVAARFYDFFLFLFGDGHLFPDDDVVAGPDGEPDDQAQQDLGKQLAVFAHSFLVVLEHLDIVVGEAQRSAPKGAEQEQEHIYIGEVAEEQHGRKDGQDDDHAAHGGGAFFLNLALETQVADCLANLFAPEQGNDFLAHEQGEQHGGGAGQERPEGQIVHQALPGDVICFQQLEQVVYHSVSKTSFTISLSSKCRFSVPIIW